MPLIIFSLSLTDSLLLAIYVRSEQNFEKNIVFNVSDMLTSRKTYLMFLEKINNSDVEAEKPHEFLLVNNYRLLNSVPILNLSEFSCFSPRYNKSCVGSIQLTPKGMTKVPDGYTRPTIQTKGQVRVHFRPWQERERGDRNPRIGETGPLRG